VIVGHYAAALIPYSGLKKDHCPFWLLLLCANLPEFLWLALALAGIEAPEPRSLLDATFSNMRVDMIYSHNLVPALLQGVLTGGIVFAWLRSRRIAAWCAFLVVFHVLCDYLVGFEHQLLGRESLPVALNSYGRAPHAAILFEFAFSVACVAWYHRSEVRAGRPVSSRRKLLLYFAFGAGILVWLPAATLPLRSLAG